MSKVAKYRRQVSEDPDIDSLLSTLSPEEMEELEKELDVADADGGVSLELEQSGQAEKPPAAAPNCDGTLNHCGKESRRAMHRELSVDETRSTEKNKEAKNGDEKGKEAPSKDLAQKRNGEAGKDSKKEESAKKTDSKVKAEPERKPKDEKAINDKVKAMEKKLLGKDKKEEEKPSALKKDAGKDKKEEGKDSALKKGAGKEEPSALKDTGKDKKAEEKSSALKKEGGKDKKEEEKPSALKKDAGKDKKEEEKPSALKRDIGKDKKEEEKASALKKDAGKDKKEEEKGVGSKKEAGKDTKGEDKEKDRKEEEKNLALKKSKADEKDKSQAEPEKAAEKEEEAEKSTAAENSTSKPTVSPPEQAKDDEASSIFDELIEKVKNNDAEVTEVNVNNSDCINNETLVRFTEALEFNTVVKVFALANTRADDHVAFAIAIMLKANKVLTSINLDSNHITGKGILAIFRALLQNNTLTELRFHNQRHICGGKTEMEIAKLLKENTTLLKLGYHFELAGPRMTVTNLLSRNMDKQRQKRLQEQKLAQERAKKDLLEVPKPGAPPKGSPKPSPQPSPKSSPKSPAKKGAGPAAPPPPPPPLAPPLINENLRNSLSPATQRKLADRALPGQEKNSRDQLLAAIRSSNLKQLKKASAGRRGQ
ncbi:LMOD1 protein, partial [Nothoprocta pentlandii]|nr:LMOD1 protein [Nothoprocta pentlandii]